MTAVTIPTRSTRPTRAPRTGAISLVEMMAWGLIDMSDDANGEIEIVVVTMQFDAIDDEAPHDKLRSVLVEVRRPRPRWNRAAGTST